MRFLPFLSLALGQAATSWSSCSLTPSSYRGWRIVYSPPAPQPEAEAFRTGWHRRALLQRN